MFSNIRIGAPLGAGFAIVLLLGTVSVVGFVQASRIYSRAQDLGETCLPSVEALGAVRSRIEDARRTSLRYLLTGDGNHRAEIRRLRNTYLAEVTSSLAAYSTRISSPAEQRLYAEIKVAIAPYTELDDRLFSLMDGRDATFSAARALASGGASQAFSVLQGADQR